MNISAEQIREILSKINDKRESGASVSDEIAELLMLSGVKGEIIHNPNPNSIPREVYSVIKSLNSYSDIKITDKGIEIAATANIYQRGEKKPTEVLLIISDGDITLKQFYKEADNEAKLKVTEIKTGKYTDGKAVVRTLNGEYTVKDDSPSNKNYTADGFYRINEYSSEGIQMGTRGVTTHNDPSKTNNSLDANFLMSQDRYTRTWGVNPQISANLQKNMTIGRDQSPYVKGEYIYYRDDNELDKLHVIENYNSLRSGVEFAFFEEHGTDDIHRIGVVEDISEDRYNSEREQFYSKESNIEDIKQKSPLASKKIDEEAERYKKEAVSHSL